MITWHNLPDILGAVGMILGAGEMLYMVVRYRNHPDWR